MVWRLQERKGMAPGSAAQHLLQWVSPVQDRSLLAAVRGLTRAPSLFSMCEFSALTGKMLLAGNQNCPELLTWQQSRVTIAFPTETVSEMCGDKSLALREKCIPNPSRGASADSRTCLCSHPYADSHNTLAASRAGRCRGRILPGCCPGGWTILPGCCP